MKKLGSGLVVLWFMWGTGSVAGVTIAKAGTAQAVIVIATDASAPQKHAAQELASFLNQVTGGKFDIVQKPLQGNASLLVGPKAAKIADSAFSTNGLGNDGLIIRTVGKDLILAGGEPRGTLYAVYTFLEDYLGCRWWTPQASLIPKKPNVVLGDLNRRYVPVMEHRDPLISPYTMDPDWAVRNKCVGQITGYSGKMEVMLKRGGGRHGWPCGHSYFTVLPPEKYFGEHPEWYSLIDGKRVAVPRDHATLCLTNKEMQKAFVENFKAEIRRAAAVYYPVQLYANAGVASPLMFVSVSPEDDSGYPCRCQCENCVAVEKAEGSPAGLALRFANQMAQAIKPEFPDKTVYMYAYHYTQKPPRITKPDPNVVVYFCPIHAASQSRPMTDPTFKRWNDDLQGWLKICNRMYVYDYPDNVTFELVPHPNLRALSANIKNWGRSGVKGYFGDGMGAGTGGTEMAELRAWLIAKLLWDPSQDSQKLIKEFADGYYGVAGKHVVTYLKVMHDAVEISGDSLDLSSPPDARFLSIETLVAGWAHLKAAGNAVKDNPVLLSRVKVAQLPEMFVFLVRWNQLKDDASCRGIEWPFLGPREDAYRQFMAVVQSNNITPSRQTQALLAKSGE